MYLFSTVSITCKIFLVLISKAQVRPISSIFWAEIPGIGFLFLWLGSGRLLHVPAGFFPLLKLLLLVNHSSLVFGRGLLLKLGATGIGHVYDFYTVMPQGSVSKGSRVAGFSIWQVFMVATGLSKSIAWTSIDLRLLTKAWTWSGIHIVTHWPTVNFSASYCRIIVAATAQRQRGLPLVVWSNCLEMFSFALLVFHDWLINPLYWILPVHTLMVFVSVFLLDLIQSSFGA